MLSDVFAEVIGTIFKNDRLTRLVIEHKQSLRLEVQYKKYVI